MRGRNGHADERSSADREGGGGFGGETMDRLELHHLMPEGADDAPAASRSPRRHRGCTKRNDPERNMAILGRLHELQPRGGVLKSVVSRASREGEHDDTDGFLRIVHPVGEAHHPRGNQLQLAERSLHFAWAHPEPDDNRRQQSHENDAEREADERREYHGLN